MRPRLLQGNSSGAGRSNGPQPTIAGSLPPTTPHHPRNGAALDNLIISLENEWQLGLKIRDSHWSPQKTDEKSLSDKVYGQIKRLHYGAKPTLTSVLESFKEHALGFPADKRLEVLSGMLKSKTQSPISRAGTPLNELPKSLKSEQPLSSQTSRPARLFYGYQRNESESHQTAIDDPGSSTDVDEDDYFTPPSPTRSRTSTRRQAGDGASSRASSRYNPMKRPSDSSNDSASSPKSTKTSRGKQPVDTSPAALVQQPMYPNLFKVPSLSMARSFEGHGNYNAPSSSVDTSFNNNDSVFSSQQTQATSANISFMTDGANDEVIDGRTRKSSISLQSLADTEAIAVLTEAERQAFELEKSRESDRLFSQEASRESNSKYGLVDEDVLLHVTSRAEAGPKPTSTPVKAVTGFAHPSLPAKVSAPSNVSALIPPPARQADSNKLPSRVAWYIRDLPKSNLFVDELPTLYTSFPYFLLFIGCRIAVANGVLLQDVFRNVDFSLAVNSPELFWGKLGGHLRTLPRDSDAVWAAAKRSFDGYTFKGKVVFETSRSGPVFKLNLLPIEAEYSCLFQRMFGSDRFLYLTFPSFQDKDKPERFTADQMPLIEAQWRLWRSSTHTFLGRKWRAFHVETIKKKSKLRKTNEDAADIRVVLFATEGLDIDRPMQVGAMLNEFFDFSRNADQNYCKAFARIDLGLSKTIPTVSFKPSQIRRVADIRADHTPEAREFNDPSLDFSSECDEPNPVMNDGCARISVGAALLLWSHYRTVTGSDEPLPSSFQGRIGCAKGMWMISAEPHTRDPYHLAIWIEVTDSQQKAVPPYDDEADNRPYNILRLTFNYLKHSFVNGSSDLHISFIPILVDRGVQRNVIADLMNARMDQERKQLMEMLDDPVRLHNWITKQGSATPPLGILSWQAALPATVPEKAKLLLRTGFAPNQSPFLARSLKSFVKQRQLWMEEKLRVPLGKTTFLLGLADPLGVLKPGEVHVQFSKPFLDEYDRSTYRNLAGEEVLVARQPACRRSDIQRMRAVAHPRLSHLVDVIVFPSRGEYPAAGKLQGGDYDGDTFWVCWEPPFVAPFRNAPAPLEALDPTDYGIVKDNKKIKDVMHPHDLSTVDNFLEHALEFRRLPSLLGRATVFAEKVAYRENCIHSKTLNALYAVHDLLVDATKQAYRFTDENFTKLVQVQLRCGNPRVPAYKQAMEANIKSKAVSEDDKGTKKGARHNPQNILDFLYFDVVRKHNTETRQALEAALPNDEDSDPDLQVPFLQLQDKNDDVLKHELIILLKNIAKIVHDWNRSLGDKSELSPDRYNKLLDTCYTAFRSLMPTAEHESHPQIAPLVYPYLGPKHPTIWEAIRSSALYTAYPKKHSFVWHMAGRELGRLKAGTSPDTYHVVPSVFADLKTKPAKVIQPEDGENENDDDFETTT